MTVIDARDVPGTRPVANVRIPHDTAMIVSARRYPTMLPNMPPGNWKIAYPQAKAESTIPNCILDNPRSPIMLSPAIDMFVRSM
jgi:hypothetical protein